MFEALTRGFRQARNRLAGLTELTESNMEPALREVRLSLLEADVDLTITKQFLARIRERALGQTVQAKVKVEGVTMEASASDQFIKQCHDELVRMMSSDGEPLSWAEVGPTGIMMVGLQGSGKTTSAAKLAKLLQREGKKPLLVAADMQRPAAVDQLQVLGKQIGIPVFNVKKSPVDICAEAIEHAKRNKFNVVIYDTAGRLAIDEVLMNELDEIKGSVWPENILLVVDAMIGQDAVKTASAFHDKLGITGVVLTKLDGDARGGAALSIREVTGAPVVFTGVGEGTGQFEPFRAEGMASRILGFGDVVGLMQDFEEAVDKKSAAEKALRLIDGEFSLDDFLEQVRTIQKMGSLRDLVDKMPFFPQGIPDGVNLDDKELDRIQAIIQSMTPSEKADPYVLVREPSRVTRISRGSGQPEVGVQELVQKFLFMRQMMNGMKQNMGLMSKIPGLKQIASARQMRKAMAGGGIPGMGMPGMPGMGMPGMPGMGMPGMPGMGMPGMPGMGMPGMPGMGMPGMPGMGMPGMPGMGMPGFGDSQMHGDAAKKNPLTKAEKNQRKAQRKRERDARKKSRTK